MEGLTNTNETGATSLGDHCNQDGVGGEQGNQRKPQHNKGGKKKKDGGNDGFAGGGGGMLRTPADIYEHPTFYSFILDMPGVDPQNIKVKVENGVLHVTGKRKKTKVVQAEEGAAKALRLERRRARYMRKFTLPSNANHDHDHVKAAYKDGVLTISISKTTPSSPAT